MKKFTFETLHKKSLMELEALKKELEGDLFEIRNRLKFQKISTIMFLQDEIEKETGK